MDNPTNPVNWFEIAAVDLDRAKRFYEAVFGIALTAESMGPLQMAWFPMVEGAPGAAGSLVKGDGYVPSTTGTNLYFSVEGIEGVLERVSANGGRTLMPRTSIGEYGFIAHFADCEGNRVGLHSVT
ncbi:MAG: VOC family protein [Deltaproteobacteria bacterium]|nr:VOC family protein [Deltaproteobacteria bacterium]